MLEDNVEHYAHMRLLTIVLSLSLFVYWLRNLIYDCHTNFNIKLWLLNYRDII